MWNYACGRDRVKTSRSVISFMICKWLMNALHTSSRMHPVGSLRNMLRSACICCLSALFTPNKLYAVLAGVALSVRRVPFMPLTRRMGWPLVIYAFIITYIFFCPFNKNKKHSEFCQFCATRNFAWLKMIFSYIICFKQVFLSYHLFRLCSKMRHVNKCTILLTCYHFVKYLCMLSFKKKKTIKNEIWNLPRKILFYKLLNFNNLIE